MDLKFFSDKQDDFNLLKDVIREDDKLFQYPLSALFSTPFTEEDFILIFVDNADTAYRLVEITGINCSIVAFIRIRSLFSPENQISGLRTIFLPCQPSYIRKMLEEERTIRKLSNGLKRHIVGRSRNIHMLRSSIILASMNSCPVHITGETGTGKTLAARMIHRMTGNPKEIVYINCANLHTSISDSDLFGHVKGAYTNASQSREGLLEKANGSSLLLDEIGDLPEDIQGKLLDTIENGTYRSIGSDTEKKSSFRLLTAGQQSLETLLEQKKLRRDFYYRISGMQIHIDPLRKHLEDIPDLIANYEEKNAIKEIRIYDYSSLLSYTWGGNVRELEHYLDRIYLNHYDTRKMVEKKEHGGS